MLTQCFLSTFFTITTLRLTCRSNRAIFSPQDCRRCASKFYSRNKTKTSLGMQNRSSAFLDLGRAFVENGADADQDRWKCVLQRRVDSLWCSKYVTLDWSNERFSVSAQSKKQNTQHHSDSAASNDPLLWSDRSVLIKKHDRGRNQRFLFPDTEENMLFFIQRNVERV